MQKQVILQRAWQDKRATLGMITILNVDHDPFFTLENPLRDDILDNRIPAGTYTCIPYSGTKYKDVFLVKDVPNRTAILLHAGNFESDTLGCILIGGGAQMLSKKPAVTSSRVAFDRFKDVVGNEPFLLTIVDVYSDQDDSNEAHKTSR